MFGIIVLFGVFLSAVLLALDTRRRRGRVSYGRVIIAVAIAFFAVGSATGQEHLRYGTAYDSMDFLLEYAGALTFLWFVSVRPKRRIDEIFQEAASLFKKGNAGQALTTFNQALDKAKSDSEKGPILFNIAGCHVQLGQKEAALRALKAAVSILPSLKPRIAREKDFQEFQDNDEFRAMITGVSETGTASQGGQPSQRSSIGTAQPRSIHAAAEEGDLAAVQNALSSGRQSVSSCDIMQRTPLHRAARGGQMAVIQFLLDKGADIKARDEYKWTPLHMAAESNKADAVKLLIDRGAVIDARDGDWRTALHRAAEHNSVNAIKVLLKIAPETLIPAGDNCGETAKAVAISMGHKEAVQMIEHYE